MNADACAAAFGKYKDYHANIGAPGRVDAGAGQRYVEVPVQVYGTLEDGEQPFNRRGSVTLHRTAEIPGATAEDKSWHIVKSDVAPRPCTGSYLRCGIFCSSQRMKACPRGNSRRNLRTKKRPVGRKVV